MLHKNECNHSYIKHVNHSFALLCNDGYVETLGQRIERLRKERNLSQLQVAQAARVSRVAVTKWESGATKNLKLENLLAMCELFGIAAEALISGTSEMLTARQTMAEYKIPNLPIVNPEEMQILKSYRKKTRSEQLMVLKLLDVDPIDFAQSA